MARGTRGKKPDQSGQLLEFDLTKRDGMSDEEMILLIDRYVVAPPPTPIQLRISPAVAKYILDKYNKFNRTKKPGKIAKYRQDMVDNKWTDTYDPLKFTTELILRDGQNRLEACVAAGVPFVTHVAFGIPDQACVNMDQGKARSGSDVLTIAGFQNTAGLAAAIRWVHLFKTNSVKQRTSFEPSQLLALVQDEYQGLPAMMTPADRIYKLTAHPKGLVAALLYLQAELNPEKAKEWSAAWEAGKDAGEFKPLALVIKRLAEIKRASQGPVQDVVRAALLVQAWNLYVAGRKGNQADIAWTMSEDFPALSA